MGRAGCQTPLFRGRSPLRRFRRLGNYTEGQSRPSRFAARIPPAPATLARVPPLLLGHFFAPPSGAVFGFFVFLTHLCFLQTSSSASDRHWPEHGFKISAP